MVGITASGIGSGLDIQGIVDTLTNADISPLKTALSKRQNSVQADISAIGKISSALSTFQDALKKLETTEDFNLNNTTISDETFFSATADNSASVGSYDIEVQQLAQAQTLATSANPISTPSGTGGGTLSIIVGGHTADTGDDQAAIDITIAAGASLADIRDAINDKDAGFTASIISTNGQQYLTIANDDSGEENGFAITASPTAGIGTGDELENLIYDPHNLSGNGVVTNSNPTITAQNAKFVINGLGSATPLESSSNTLTDVIEGVTINLLKAETNTTTRLEVGKDKESLKEKLDEFVTSYNDLMKVIDDQTFYNEASKSSGALYGDSSIRGLKQQLRTSISATISSSSTFDTLTDIGLETDRAGTLSLNSSTFDDAYNNNYSDIALLFTDGAFDVFNNIIEAQTDDTKGILSIRDQVLDERLEKLKDERFELDTREERVYQTYLKQFASLDSILGQLNAQNSYVSQQLANLPTYSFNKK